MYDHTQACPYCTQWNGNRCAIYSDTSWVNRRGGCPSYPYREIPRLVGEYVDGEIVFGKNRPGQQKQKHQDRTYHSKNDGKRKYKFKV